MPLSTIYHNGVRVIVFMPLSRIYHNRVRVIVFNATFNNISVALNTITLTSL
jgi:hypothetical protein